MKEVFKTLNEWLGGIVGFLFTIASFVTALMIRDQLSRKTDRRQYLARRDAIIAELQHEQGRLCGTAETAQNQARNKIHQIMCELEGYKVWEKKDALRLNDFCIALEEFMGMHESEETGELKAPVRTCISSYNDLSNKLNRIIAILQRESTAQ